MSDLSFVVGEALAKDWPLVVGYLASLWWIKKNVLKDIIRSSLLNGGGDIIRTIVRDETAAQTGELTRHTATTITMAISDHEKVDRQYLEDRLTVFQRELVPKNGGRHRQS